MQIILNETSNVFEGLKQIADNFWGVLKSDKLYIGTTVVYEIIYNNYNSETND